MGKFKIFIRVICIVIIFLLLLYFYAKTLIYKTSYIDIIEKNCEGTGIDPYLILSIIKVESGFNTNAVSSKEAKGLMQVKDETYSDVSNMFPNKNEKIDPFDPETNIKIGVAYFNKLINRYNGNYYIAILAYNGGLGNVTSWINKGLISNDLASENAENVPFPETKKYLKKVISTYNIYKFIYNL
ncbi:MAG: lytic transglycosylase domain-containing protein [Clostridia bacterium]